MKNIYKLLLFFVVLFIFNFNIKALTPDEAGEVVANYAKFVYNSKKNEFIYKSPSEVNNKLYSGFKMFTKGNEKYYGADCNAFVAFVVYNAFQLPYPGVRVARRDDNKWISRRNFYYEYKVFPLKTNTTVQKVANEARLKDILKPGDLIGIVAYNKSEMNFGEKISECQCKNTHIMIYIGEGNYIHMTSSGGVKKASIKNISFGSKTGMLDRNIGKVIGSITILRLKNTEEFPSKLLNEIYYPDGSGNYITYGSNAAQNKEMMPFFDNWDKISALLNGISEISSGKLSCGSIGKVIVFMQKIFNLIKVAAFLLLIVFTAIDFTKAVSVSDDDAMKKALNKFVKRAMITVIIVILPSLINLILGLVAISGGTCRIS